MKFNKLIVVLSAVLAFAGCAEEALESDDPAESDVAPSATPTEIRWDNWGVPHITGETREAALYGFGWAQMQGHANLLLELYGKARGRGAEYWGEDHLDDDILIRTMGLPASGAALYQAQSQEFQSLFDAFVKGMNDFAAANPGRIDVDKRPVLPIRPEDVLAHTQRSLHLTFVAGRSIGGVGRWKRDAANDEVPGSNAWAIAPSRSESGNALLLINPHLPWNDLFLFYEAQITAPGLNAYGTTLIGWPFLAIAFNENLGWTHTVNTYDGADLYELEVEEDGYLFDGATRAFDARDEKLLVRQGDGTLEERTITLRNTVHGPVVAEAGGKVLALRVAGLNEEDRAGIFEQYWDMAAASDLDGFETALSRLQQPMFNVVYADRNGDIFYAFNALQPVRGGGDVAHWAGVVDGGSADSLWQGYRAYDELPKYRNPPGGFVQNANDPPWTSTFPQVLDPADFPPDTAPERMPFRPQHSANLLMADDSISFAELEQYRRSNRLIMADAVLDDLISAARADGAPDLSAAADVLENWDRETNAASRGAMLFMAWVEEMRGQGQMFRVSWDASQPLETPRGLADPAIGVQALARAAQRLVDQFGSADVAWGEAVRVRRGEKDLPDSAGPGGLGSFRVAFLSPRDGGGYNVVGGNSFVSIVEFGDRVRARGILTYGNTGDRTAANYGDQLELFAEGRMRDIWFYADDIAANTARIEALDPDQ